jgi:hypothetical protein
MAIPALATLVKCFHSDGLALGQHSFEQILVLLGGFVPGVVTLHGIIYQLGPGLGILAVDLGCFFGQEQEVVGIDIGE